MELVPVIIAVDDLVVHLRTVYRVGTVIAARAAAAGEPAKAGNKEDSFGSNPTILDPPKAGTRPSAAHSANCQPSRPLGLPSLATVIVETQAGARSTA